MTLLYSVGVKTLVGDAYFIFTYILFNIPSAKLGLPDLRHLCKSYLWKKLSLVTNSYCSFYEIFKNTLSTHVSSLFFNITVCVNIRVPNVSEARAPNNQSILIDLTLLRAFREKTRETGNQRKRERETKNGS